MKTFLLVLCLALCALAIGAGLRHKAEPVKRDLSSMPDLPVPAPPPLTPDLSHNLPVNPSAPPTVNYAPPVK